MKKKEKLKLEFTGFWPNFIKNDNYFYHLLKQEYNIIFDQNNPDLLIYSNFFKEKKDHEKYDLLNTKKIFYTGENIDPNKFSSDGTLSYLNTQENNYRLPNWVLYLNWFNVPFKKNRDQSYLLDVEKLINKNIKKIKKSKFCCFIASKPEGKRVEFVPKLNEFKKVDCSGRLFNNTKKIIKGRGDQKWKINYLKKYKFNICFENSSSEGYVTEKMIQSMYVNSIPIYWGAPNVDQDFNINSFLNFDNFKNDEEFIEKILLIDNNFDEYLNIISQPWFPNNSIPEKFLPQNILKFINGILNN